MNKTFFIHTIGCKLNQFDSECIRHALVARGWTCDPAGRQAAVHIINSCTVTAKSDARCRNAVRRVRRRSPGSFILVTGCYAETQPARLAAVSEIDLVLGNDRKADIPAVLDEIAGGACSGEALERCRRSKDRAPQEIDSFFGHSRAFIKIQDGCNASCSYCIVPRARGRSRSVAPQAILRQVDALAASGYGEIVLTGIHIGRYGADLDEPMTLAQLVALILERTRVQRLRLSSIELTEVTPELISLPRSTERVAPHFHIPLQSGDDTILRRMNRPYRAEQFRETIAAIAADIPGAAIGTDIIVGFPGEGERHFEKTLALVRDLPLSYFHVFAFSPRPFTAAAAMPCHVPPS
jgi:threonylcarbamoyladenosine tRNA methylthiotransferase MtaB